ncbi:MAG: DNA polymerase III subunit alpha [Caldilineaceae bacterium]|nr:DNA polymerase III subunit alpha [Caldilineaceae bacterium]
MTHLHVHSHFTLLGATPRVDHLVARAVEEGLPALALTDTHALYGAVAFARACRRADLHPILGMTTRVQPPADLLSVDKPDQLVLLAAGPEGYRSLCRLSSLIQNHPNREERARRGLSWDDLRAQHAGLLCITGGRQGWIDRLLRRGEDALALRLAGRIAGLFGERQTFLALEIHEDGDHAFARSSMDIGRRLGLPVVAVQPVYTLHPEDRYRLRLLAAICEGCTVEAVPADALPDAGDVACDLHWLSPDEMIARFAAFPAALAQIDDIVALCDPCLPDGRPIWPNVLPNADAADPIISSSPTVAVGHHHLTIAAHTGLLERYANASPLRPRLDHELAAIVAHGYAPLFLLVADIVSYARQHEIPVSTRGSVANSLVAYCLGITDVDPMEHDLLFERFLNPARRELPDIDLDFCSRRRDEVLEYVRQRYGEDRVALVATVNTFQPKSAVRETAKAFGLSDAEAGALAKRVRGGWHPDPRRRESTTLEDLLALLDDPMQQEIVRQAYTLIDMPNHLSIHPGGVVVTPGPLTDYTPLQHTPKGFAITQFDHGDVESLGLIKVDLLGIRALTVLSDAVRLIRKCHDPDFRLDAIPAEDGVTGDLLMRGDTIGVFQCESSGAQRTLRQLKARNAADLAVANAFFKPGPATGGMADAFVRRYRGEAAVSFLHPSLEPILRGTKGVLIFQEQVLRLATEIAGLSWAEAEHLRRGMSKFRPDEMENLRDRFVSGCCREDGPGLSEAQARTLYEQVAAFAGYGFNQGHATAYAAVSFRSAYLRAHYPAEFLCARLADWGGFHHQAVYIAEAQRLGIPVYPPHVNHSDRKFTISAAPSALSANRQLLTALFMGLEQIRDLRRESIRAIVRERRRRPFEDLRDLLARVDLQPKEIDHLIRCGALEGLGSSRAGLLHEAAEIRRAGSVEQLGFGFFDEIPPESPAERIAWETRILGQPISVHPVELLDNSAVTPLADLPRHPNRSVTVRGVRLPGWTGGKGFFLNDGRSYVIAIPAGKIAAPKPWQPITVHGRWQIDPWGGGSFVVEEGR